MRFFLALALVAPVLMSFASARQSLAADAAALLDVSKGQIPNDTGNDNGETKMSITKSKYNH